MAAATKSIGKQAKHVVEFELRGDFLDNLGH
jgi:hypothetical protein